MWPLLSLTGSRYGLRNERDVLGKSGGLRRGGCLRELQHFQRSPACLEAAIASTTNRIWFSAKKRSRTAKCRRITGFKLRFGLCGMRCQDGSRTPNHSLDQRQPARALRRLQCQYYLGWRQQ